MYYYNGDRYEGQWKGDKRNAAALIHIRVEPTIKVIGWTTKGRQGHLRLE